MNKEQLIAKCKEIEPCGTFEVINRDEFLEVFQFHTPENYLISITNGDEVHIETDMNNLKILNKERNLKILILAQQYFKEKVNDED